MPIATPHDAPLTVTLTDAERLSGVMEELNFFRALEAFHRDGVVVVANAINVAHIDHLNEKMTADAHRYMAGHHKLRYAGTFKAGQGTGKGGGNLSMVPPLEKEYMHPEIYANPFAFALMSAIMGPEPELRYIRSNTLSRSTDRQMVHGDIAGHFPDFTTGIVYNTYLVDTGPWNGATEMWLGTHRFKIDDHIHFAAAQIKEEALEARRLVRPPVYPTIKRGSIVIRDTRLWHAGVPNPTDEIRVMLALMCFAKWWGNTSTSLMPSALKPHIASLEQAGKLKIPCEWSDNPNFDYLENEFAVAKRSVMAPDGWDDVAPSQIGIVNENAKMSAMVS